MTHDQAVAGATFTRTRDGDFDLITIRFPATVPTDSPIYRADAAVAAVRRTFLFAAGILAGAGLITRLDAEALRAACLAAVGRTA